MEELNIITDKEYPILAKVLIEQKAQKYSDKETIINETLEDVRMIDQMLTMMKRQSIMRRKSPMLKKQLDAILHLRVFGGTAAYDARRKQYVFSNGSGK